MLKHHKLLPGQFKLFERQATIQLEFNKYKGGVSYSNS